MCSTTNSSTKTPPAQLTLSERYEREARAYAAQAMAEAYYDLQYRYMRRAMIAYQQAERARRLEREAKR